MIGGSEDNMRRDNKVLGGCGCGEASAAVIAPVDTGVPVLSLTVAALGVGGALAATAIARKAAERALHLDKVPEFDVTFDVTEGSLGLRDARTTAKEKAEMKEKAEERKAAHKAVAEARTALAKASSKEEKAAAKDALKEAEEALQELLPDEEEAPAATA